MILRGQGDSPVRICEPCKKLEEAARFEMRHGYKSRVGKGSSKVMVKSEDEVLNQILGTDGKESFSSGQFSNNDVGSYIQRSTSSASSSNTRDGFADIGRSHSIDGHNIVENDTASSTPEELRQQAMEEKMKYKILKGEKKPEEALRAYKRGKELERQAEALEISMRKHRKRFLSSGNKTETQNKDGSKESARTNKLVSKAGAEKEDFAAELRELGWSDMDNQDENKRSANVSLEGELSSLLGEVSQKANKDISTRVIDKTPVVALKRKALMLKREGKLTEAKEELKRAKVLEKQLEEQELLAEAEDSDDELSAIIQSMDNDEQDDFLIQYEQEPDFNLLGSTVNDLGADGNFEVTDEDMEDPEIAAALKSLGWTEESNHGDNIVPQSAPPDREALSMEIISLKREALNQKRAGNVAEAMAQLKKAKLLERDLENYKSQAGNLVSQNLKVINSGSVSQVAEKTAKVDDGNVDFTKDLDANVAPRSRLMIQKELLSLKKKAFALRREGRLDEAEEELKKGKVLECQLEEMDNALNVKATCSKKSDLTKKDSVISRKLLVGEGEEGDEVTDQDMNDPAYLSMLKNLGWNDADNELPIHPSKPSARNDNLAGKIRGSSSSEAISDVPARPSRRRSKAEVQRELLGLKRKALSLRRQGQTDEADEVLKMAKVLEAEMADIETPNRVQVESNWPKDRVHERPFESTERVDEDDVTEEDMHDPALLSALKNLASKDGELEPVTMQEKPSNIVSGNPMDSTGSYVLQSGVSLATPRSKGEIQRQLLDLKRKALALRRKGETEEAEELLKMAKVLEAQMEEFEGPKEHLLDASKGKKSASFQSQKNYENQGKLVAEVAVNMQSAPVAVVSNGKTAGSSHLIEDNYPLLGKLGLSNENGLPTNSGRTEDAVFVSPPGESVNLVDLLTGNNGTSSQVPAGKPDDKRNSGSHISSTARSSAQLDSSSNLCEDLGSKNDVKTEKIVVNAYENPHVHEANSAEGFVSQNSQTSLRQEVLAHKRKAVALKREGKLTEAREELRRAKLLEKSLEEDNVQPKPSQLNVSMTISKIHSDGQKEHDASNLAPKPMSARDRFKLQQESLGHKRTALKLRREGRMDEAEAEFERAKNLEAQLEELAHDSKSAASEGEATDDAAVEDLLDPQLLSALKAVGLHDANMLSKPERPEPVKPSAQKIDNFNHERSHLEEWIKAEKVKAVNLKRAGKQTEALDALRRVKLFERKLSSLASN
ncbi:Vacuolar protein sorting-associated protein 27 [Melia azedarach]|nr:Vacuolar protein sorting-associated protein 27 [Melia azedarach]